MPGPGDAGERVLTPVASALSSPKRGCDASARSRSSSAAPAAPRRWGALVLEISSGKLTEN